MQVDCGARPFGKRVRPFARRARPFGERGALVACLVGGLVISSFSFMQLRVDDNLDPLAVIQHFSFVLHTVCDHCIDLDDL